MKERIVNYCKIIEKEHNVKILFAVESGSRLWKMDSQDSDYDVRFVFVQPVEAYISINNKNATEMVINRMEDEGMIDLSGFDIFKFCKLLAKSNPSIIEWMQSDILYLGNKPEGLKHIALTQFDPSALFYHYQSMCKQNYEKYLACKQMVTYKKYLYAMRGLVNAKYIRATEKLPSIQFPETLEKMKNIIPKEIIEELQDTICKKKEGKEKEIIKNIVQYDTFIEKFLNEEKTVLVGSPISKELIDQELRKIVLGVNLEIK